MKKLLLLMCTIFIFSGCTNKNATAEKFKTTLEKKEFSVHDVIEQYGKDLVTSALVAKNENYQIEFLTFKNVDSAKNSFQINRTAFKKNKTESSKENSVSKEKHSKYTLTTDDTFYLISRVDNTLVYLKADGSYKKECEKIVKELGY